MRSSGNAPSPVFILGAAHALGLHLLFQLQILFQPVTPGEYAFSGFDVLSANSHCRRQSVTLGLDLGNLIPILTAAQTVIAFLASGPQFSYFSLFSTDKVRNIFRCVQLFPANQLCLTADSVQVAAFLPQFRGERAATVPFGQNTQAVAVVEIQPPETADLLYCAERAFYS
jgi:hypothetical protein